jgi:hypothetical protein
MARLEKLDLRLPPSAPKVLSTALARLHPAPAYTPSYTVSVPFSSLDFNGHVNNTEYVRWALDGLHGLGPHGGSCTAGRCSG